MTEEQMTDIAMKLEATISIVNAAWRGGMEINARAFEEDIRRVIAWYATQAKTAPLKPDRPTATAFTEVERFARADFIHSYASFQLDIELFKPASAYTYAKKMAEAYSALAVLAMHRDGGWISDPRFFPRAGEQSVDEVLAELKRIRAEKQQ